MPSGSDIRIRKQQVPSQNPEQPEAHTGALEPPGVLGVRPQTALDILLQALETIWVQLCPTPHVLHLTPVGFLRLCESSGQVRARGCGMRLEQTSPFLPCVSCPVGKSPQK